MISDEAVEAAADALKRRLAGVVDDDDQWEWKHDARALLEAAAPHMLAGAWDAGADAGLSWDENQETEFTTPNPYRSQT